MKFDIAQESYIQFRNIAAERTSKIIAWVGSGLSAQVNLPTWKELIEILIDATEKKAHSFDVSGQESILRQCDDIRKLSDYWLAFERIKNIIGQTSYRDTIRNALSISPSADIPQTYQNLWKMRISGLINLNIDRMATRARQLHTKATAIEFSGKDIPNFLHALKSPQPFILNLHGNHEDYSSWIFTRNELNRLSKTSGYEEFLRSCLLTSTILFIGISADDEAVGGHLEKLKMISEDIGTHFWVTDRRDIVTDSWAENLGIRVIRYDSKDKDHSALGEMFSDLLSYVPVEETAPPVTPPEIPNEVDAIADPKELSRMESEKIRRILNRKALEILNSGEKAYEKYEEFFKKYDEAIYRAWYTSEEESNNKLLEYRLESMEAKGAFGKVYRARDKEGKQLAVKILLEEERRKSEFLQSFRRGVRSMRILTERNVQGIVGYKNAYEIPSFVVMDWIDGPNIDKAKRSKMINDWTNILKIGKDLAIILENAHRIPERVLHRDLRPPNIMLKGFYDNPNTYEVVVLDFDLSWHLGASEKSLVGAGTTTGYLAPEQIHPQPNVSTRHSAVDSFGLGMTLFFLVAGRDPYPAENMHTNWEETVKSITSNMASEVWLSLPNRFSRIIINATKKKQSERWDLNQIRVELERLYDLVNSPSSVESAELIAEEIFSRTSRPYNWDSDKLCAFVTMMGGIKISLMGHESKKQIILEMEWLYQGASTTKQINRKIERAIKEIFQKLDSANWKIESKSKGDKTIHISASHLIENAKKHIIKLADNINSLQESFIKLTQ